MNGDNAREHHRNFVKQIFLYKSSWKYINGIVIVEIKEENSKQIMYCTKIVFFLFLVNKFKQKNKIILKTSNTKI